MIYIYIVKKWHKVLKVTGNINLLSIIYFNSLVAIAPKSH